MKNKYKIILVVLLGFQIQSCVNDSQLEVEEYNVLSAENLDPDKLVIAAYSAIDYRYNTGQFRDLWPFDHAPSNWATSDLRAGDAYKGGGGTGDNPGGGMLQLETHDIFPSSENVYNLWRAIYFGIKRVDTALRVVTAKSEQEYPARTTRIGELKVLRAHFYFEAFKNFGSFVWYDENTPIAEINKIPNSFDSAFMWSKIEADLNDAISKLPETQTELGRANKMVAYAFLCKAQIFQKKWANAIESADKVIASGKYQLVSDLEKLYSIPGYGDRENIFAIQFSIKDGSQYGNLNFGDLLNAPDSPGDDANNPYLNGDDFHKPSQNLVNSFKVGSNGLPLFDTYNNSNVTSTDAVDPRLDHTVGRPGITWKDWSIRQQQLDWSRDPATYGYFLNKKNVISPKSNGLASNPTGFPWALGNLDFPIIKYSDLLLWKAEALIESGNVVSGISIINQIRTRAKNSPYVKDFVNPTQNAANYSIGMYPTTLSQAEAIKALRMERRLELANEGHTFYDLVRWGIAEQYVNNYIQTEKTRRTYLTTAVLQSHELYLPIPQIEIDASAGVLKQRTGY
ncbi:MULTISPECIES: RagB/SusD family nutrient uptake outer membrane protein [Flavobacterium]|uniref:RagB/SusD family nutrient uptake outer membrane protein n=1 Tax=Flavobacterium keumense TaxID=1306518 RepID=A0ABY8N7J1_9FLAO|nr:MULTISPECIES: RagB/SusD family nutrient uptake outer membrane protein [Flavobacterium]WGK95118.1 RagB/SusD family nutrient uptake outer membrane protein [Flavobacterium keumense]